MLNCPYCSNTYGQFSGLSAHMRLEHLDNWKGSIDESLPLGRDVASLGSPEAHPLKGKIPEAANQVLVAHPEIRRGPRPKRKGNSVMTRFMRESLRAVTRKSVRAVAGKGEKKPPIKSPCPYCSFVTNHPPGLARHIKFHHPKHWHGAKYLRPKKAQSAIGRPPSAPTGINGRTCPVCEKVLGSRKLMTQHLRLSHGQSITQLGADRRQLALGGRPSFPKGVEGRTCPVCHKQFGQRPLMTVHLRKVHQRSITEFAYGKPDELASVKRSREQQIIEARRAYQRKWAHKNRDKVRAGYERQKLRRQAARATAAVSNNGPAPTPVVQEIHAAQIKFCPECGHNLQPMLVALGMLQQIPS